MKKFLFLFPIFVLISPSFFAQIKGISKDVIIHSDVEFVQNAFNNHETWLYVDYGKNKGVYMMTFEMNPVGYKHEVEEVEKLCNLNNLDFNNPDQDNSLIPDYATSILDYSNINLGLQSGSCEVKKFWYLSINHNRYQIAFLDNDKVYGIAVRRVEISSKN